MNELNLMLEALSTELLESIRDEIGVVLDAKPYLLPMQNAVMDIIDRRWNEEHA